jgi:hypothetical protein
MHVVTAGRKNYAQAFKRLIDRIKPRYFNTVVSVADRERYLAENNQGARVAFKDVRIVVPFTDVVMIVLDDQSDISLACRIPFLTPSLRSLL